jgi:putative transposase
MKYNPEKHHRKSIRISNYDYSNRGAYFVTICTKDRECLFGEIIDGEMVLNNTGEIVQKIWDELSENYDGIVTDSFRIMPNHIHGIIIIKNENSCKIEGNLDNKEGQTWESAPTISLSTVIQRFKSMSTKRIKSNAKESDLMMISNKLWQRNYYEHVIRNESELNRIREYIECNPQNWDADKENPKFYK